MVAVRLQGFFRTFAATAFVIIGLPLLRVASAQGEGAALQSIWQAVGSPPALAADDWASPGSYCALTWVDCNETSSINSIKLSNLSISAQLSDLTAGLLQLPTLYQLDLSMNSFTGSLPVAWTGLSAQIVLLQENQIKGGLPAAWSNWDTLLQLNVSSNLLNGTLPPEWGSMKSLKWLGLSFNGLTGTLPDAWAASQTLLTLHLNNNKLSGALPASWASMKNFVEMNFETFESAVLRLSNNQFSGTLPPEWAGMQNVVFLFLNGNQLSGALPTAWSNFGYNLIMMDLSNNRGLSGAIPPSWSKLNTWILSIGVEGTGICGGSPPRIGSNPQLSLTTSMETGTFILYQQTWQPFSTPPCADGTGSWSCLKELSIAAPPSSVQPAASPLACGALCAGAGRDPVTNAPRCRFFTFTTDGTCQLFANSLRDGMFAVAPNGSARLTCSTSRWTFRPSGVEAADAPGSFCVPNYTIMGPQVPPPNSNSNARFAVASKSDCAAACTSSPSCTYYNFYPALPGPGTSPQCQLLNSPWSAPYNPRAWPTEGATSCTTRSVNFFLLPSALTLLPSQ